MKTNATFFLALLVASVMSIPVRRSVDPSLVPDLGATAGKNPTGTGDCDGAVNGTNGLPIKVPCACPPDRQTFLAALNANVAAGHAVNNPSVKVSFPTSSSIADINTRFNAFAVTIQNLHGPGKGCPIVSTTLQAQQAAIDSGKVPPAGAPAPPTTVLRSSAPAAPTPSSSSSAASSLPSTSSIVAGGVDPNLVPDLGATAGKNPTGTGDCDGAVNGTNGLPIKVPCACPPDRQTFLAALNANVAAGHAVNNPSVKVSFPTSSSIADINARFNAFAVTIQNLHGPGKGCPIVSTTLQAQQAAIDSGKVPPAGAPAPSATVLCSPAPAAPTPSSSSSAASSLPSTSPIVAGSVDPNLVPDLGATAGKNPTGTGDCDGAVNGTNGLPIKVPCACPPDRQTFLAALNANVAAGHAVNNPSVKVSFPTSSSIADIDTRFNAFAVTIQNLHGPGKGCPIVSTTLQAQQAAIDSGKVPPA